jgi:hypothetical protein
VHATVSAFGSLDDVPIDYWPVILEDNINEPGAAGYHTDENGQPFALVQIDSTWPLTASHETLEMLADPFGNRTVAGSPPVGSPPKIAGLKRVLYLVEVCDPCEGDQFAYQSNGVTVSDFITPHYYDPEGGGGFHYSFRNHIKQPHDVLEDGYVSFGNAIDNHWYQIVVRNGKRTLHDLGVLNRQGRSLREAIDAAVRVRRKEERYRLKPLAGAAQASGPSATDNTGTSRAENLRTYIKKL